MEKILVLVNPMARHGEMQSRWEKQKGIVLALLGSKFHGCSIDVKMTNPEDHGEGIVREGLKSGVTKVVVVGGDGTISEALQGFFENKTVINSAACLIVLPAGRGDDFLKTLVGERFFGSDAGWQAAISLIRKGREKSCDVAEMEFRSSEGASVGSRYVANVVSFAYGGLVVDRVHRARSDWDRMLNQTGLAYAIQTLMGIKEYSSLPMKVRVDGADFFEGKVLAGFVLNGRYHGGGVCWDSKATIDDGLLNLVLVEPLSPLAIARSLPLLMQGYLKGVPGIHHIQGSNFEIMRTGGGDLSFPLFEIDGDQPEPKATCGAVFKALPGAVQAWRK
ncbi:diacylglycerol kinase family protein [Bdellovibrionota bacterium FG-2]